MVHKTHKGWFSSHKGWFSLVRHHGSQERLKPADIEGTEEQKSRPNGHLCGGWGRGGLVCVCACVCACVRV